MFVVHDGEVWMMVKPWGARPANRDRTEVLYRFPKDAERYVRNLMQQNF